MKKIKLFPLFLMLVVVIPFSCSKDKDDNKPLSEIIVGTWKPTDINFKTGDNNLDNIMKSFMIREMGNVSEILDEYGTMEFTADHRCINWRDGNKTSEGSYSISEDNITISSIDGDKSETIQFQVDNNDQIIMIENLLDLPGLDESMLTSIDTIIPGASNKIKNGEGWVTLKRQ
ncbi:MAG: lipocalin family protein [Bacteroidales bacterium]|jgi:hypothetical protein|nr:lipocalin family protein [Bacteroidales bacterium]